MYRTFLLLFLLIGSGLYAETNSTDTNATDTNTTNKVKKSKLTELQVKEQMAREAEYAKTQSFTQGDDYDLKAVEVNMESLENIPSIEPDYDFDMTDVYRDDL